MKHDQMNSRRTLMPQRRRSHTAGLLSRLLPAVLLTVGLLCWLSTVSPRSARAQAPYQNQGYGNGLGVPAGNPNTGARNPYPSTQYPNSFGPTAGAPQARTALAPGNSGIPAPPPESVPGTAVGQLAEDGTMPSDDAEASAMSWLTMPDWIAKVLAGGWLMLPLAFCSLVVITLSLERLVALRRGRVIPRPFVQRFTECVEDGVLSYDEANELCKEFDCPVSEVFRAALRRWGRPMFEIEQAVMDAGDRVSDGLRKYLRVFHAISNVAPLMGLLGTVIGMIDAFDVISDQQSIGQPEMLANGISMALMTTAGGLSVAIPAYLAYMYFSSKSDRYLGEIEKLCQRVIDCISAEGLESAGSARQKKRKAA
ncbi:MAG: MotA/TolQ/ExbB proton channel family protein [Planctomycetota bacterium]